MSKFSEPATGKCEHCGDQLLSIPGRTPEQPRRIICPICTANELELRPHLFTQPDEQEQLRKAEGLLERVGAILNPICNAHLQNPMRRTALTIAMAMLELGSKTMWEGFHACEEQKSPLPSGEADATVAK